MLNMRYKDFVWPNNPFQCSLTSRRETVTHKFPGGGYYLEDLGKGLRILTGTGEFFGYGAYENMQKLIDVFEKGGAGKLIHPVIQLKQAIFRELELLQEPREDYVLYRFAFWEDDSQVLGTANSAGGTGSHEVQNGESLWEIAARYGTTAENLLAVNGWIQNPNVLQPGKQVLIP